MAACGEEAPASTQTTVAEPQTEVSVYDDAASITFADGNFAFLGSDTTYNPAAKETIFSLTDRNGEKAVKIESADAGKLYAGIQIDALLGDKLSEVKTVEFVIESEVGDTFTAASGNVVSYLGEENVLNSSAWSIYLEKNAVKKISYEFPDTAVEGNALILTLEVNADSNSFDKEVPTALYLYSISFKDASGNVLAVDTTAEYKTASNEVDRSNLLNCTSYVNFADFACTGDAWGQNGFDIPQEVLDALVPGTTLEIEFASEDNTMWLVFPDATIGWSRVAQGEAYINNSGTTAQIDYEQIAAILGEDKSAWGARLQCEAQTAWEVFSVKVGTVGTPKEFAKTVEFADFACTGDGWAQNGFDMPQEVIDALVPGSVVEVSFASEDNTMWLVFPGATVGWSRIAQGEAEISNGKAYITYEQIAAVVGEDKANWGTIMQCEAQTAWEVYSVAVGTLSEASNETYAKAVDFADFACTGDGWAQNGFDMPQEIIDALVPGTVVEVTFTSEDNTMWLVFPGASIGWSRIAQGEAKITDGKAYITYEQIAAVLGEDKANWGTTMQCEAQTAWEVYSVSVGSLEKAAEAPRLHKFVNFENFACTGDGWAQNGFEMPTEILDALVPGSAVEVSFASEDDTMWLVFPGATIGWSRIAQGEAVIKDGKAYITYDQIAAVVGEDKANWGTTMQCEAQTAWEVYSVRVGQQ